MSYFYYSKSKLSYFKFFKTLSKGNNFSVWRVREARGKSDFDHHFCVFDNLTEKIELFAWWHLFRPVKRIIFTIKKYQTDFSFRFCKIGLRNTLSLFIFGRKNGRLLFCFVCLLQLCPILAFSFFN